LLILLSRFSGHRLSYPLAPIVLVFSLALGAKAQDQPLANGEKTFLLTTKADAQVRLLTNIGFEPKCGGAAADSDLPMLGLYELEWWYFDGPDFDTAEWVGWRFRHCEGNTEGWGVRTAYGEVVRQRLCDDFFSTVTCTLDGAAYSCAAFCGNFGCP
jgi:hypothetical protein